MNKIGKLYTVKKHYWYVFSDRHKAMVTPSAYAAYESCIMSNNAHKGYLKPNDLVLLLGAAKDCKKVLLTNGDIGWIAYHDWCCSYFEKM